MLLHFPRFLPVSISTGPHSAVARGPLVRNNPPCSQPHFCPYFFEVCLEKKLGANNVKFELTFSSSSKKTTNNHRLGDRTLSWGLFNCSISNLYFPMFVVIPWKWKLFYSYIFIRKITPKSMSNLLNRQK